MTSHQALRSAVAFLALAAHNAEEALFARDWALANRELLARYPGLMEFWSGSAIRLSLITLTLVLLALAVSAARAPRRGTAVYLLLGALAFFAANAVVPHVAGAVALRAYVPGVATAVALVLPAATWAYVSTLREGYATERGTVMAAVVGMALYASVAGAAWSWLRG